MSASDPADELLAALHGNRARIAATLEVVSNERVGVDLVYRFWHQSFKLYPLQEYTTRIVSDLTALCPSSGSLHPWFQDLVAAGTGIVFDPTHNDDWVSHTRPIVDAFFHARHMLTLAHSASIELTEMPEYLPSGFATLLELYQVR